MSYGGVHAGKPIILGFKTAIAAGLSSSPGTAKAGASESR